ncbi:MAG: hypothetical protein JKY48_17290 [Flavobacteriales bacterium]|nr:hypothetical protein [Flavobacteriales bacterium]
MKKINYFTLSISIGCLLAVVYSFKVSEKNYEFKTISIVESIVPSGLGRSRIINALEPRNYNDFTKIMPTDDKVRNKSKRDDIRVKNYEETKLLNFYNLGGIRFQNIAANDAVVDSRINAFLDEGWEIISINTGVEAYGGKGDLNGLYITRVYFKKPK